MKSVEKIEERIKELRYRVDWIIIYGQNDPRYLSEFMSNLNSISELEQVLNAKD